MCYEKKLKKQFNDTIYNNNKKLTKLGVGVLLYVLFYNVKFTKRKLDPNLRKFKLE